MTASLKQEQRNRIIASQRDAFKRHGFHPNALLWSSKEIQETRFNIIANIGIQAGDSVLDIGCGFGDFNAYLKRTKRSISYTGIDLSQELIEEGRKHYPDAHLVVGDLFDFNPDQDSFDYVTLSGTLNRKFDGASQYTYAVISRMFDTCRKGIAFNLLDARDEWTASRWDLQSFQPGEIIEFVAGLSSDYTLVDNYLKNDFSVYVYKETK